MAPPSVHDHENLERQAAAEFRAAAEGADSPLEMQQSVADTLARRDSVPPPHPDRVAAGFVKWLANGRYCTIDGIWHRHRGTHYSPCELADVVAAWGAYGQHLAVAGQLPGWSADDALDWHRAGWLRVATHAVRRAVPDLDRQPNRDQGVVNTRAGVFDLLQRDFVAYQPPAGRVWTYSAPWALPTEDDKALLRELMANWHRNPVERRYVWDLLGSAFAGILPRSFIEIWGAPRSGKSTFLHVLGALGPEVNAILEEKDVKQSGGTHQGSLKRALVNASRFVIYPSEVGSGDADTALLKRWSGRDRIRVRGSGDRYGAEAEYEPTGTILLTTNTPPPRHESEAMQDRQRVIRFAQVQTYDPAMHARIAEARTRPEFAAALIIRLSEHAADVFARQGRTDMPDGVPIMPETMRQAWDQDATAHLEQCDPLLSCLLRTEGAWDGTKRTATQWMDVWGLDPDVHDPRSVGRRMTARKWGTSRTRIGETVSTVRWPVGRAFKKQIAS